MGICAQKKTTRASLNRKPTQRKGESKNWEEGRKRVSEQ